jgi:polysaccharide export outer membrane protein
MLFRSICLATSLVCASTRIIAADSVSASTLKSVPTERTDYIFQPYDLIQVVVFQEPDLAREVRLSQDSTINLPLIGAVDLTGKTVREAQDVIRQRYDRDYLVNPQINITVMEYAKETVNVLGAVNTPGAITIPPDLPLKLLDAITRAGGFSRLADRKKVKLTRLNADGKTSTSVINADDIIQSNSTDSWVLSKGDVIFVPERIL